MKVRDDPRWQPDERAKLRRAVHSLDRALVALAASTNDATWAVLEFGAVIAAAEAIETARPYLASAARRQAPGT